MLLSHNSYGSNKDRIFFPLSFGIFRLKIQYKLAGGGWGLSKGLTVSLVWLVLKLPKETMVHRPSADI